MTKVLGFVNEYFVPLRGWWERRPIVYSVYLRADVGMSGTGRDVHLCTDSSLM